MPLSSFLRCEGEVGEIGSLLRGAFCPEDEKLASIFSGVRAVCLAGLEMQRSAGLVLLALIGEVALSHIERLGHAFVEMCRNDRAGAHTDVQHDRPQRVIRVADPQRDVALTGERESIRLELIVEYFLIDHDTVSCASKSPPADLIWEAARLFLELTARGRLDRAAPSLSPPQSRPPPGHKRDMDFSSHCCGCRFSAALTPYRGGGATINDLLGGHIKVAFL